MIDCFYVKCKWVDVFIMKISYIMWYTYKNQKINDKFWSVNQRPEGGKYLCL